jgi:choline-phosphate cytidylyltransferase/glycerol-3-phosphate cytidylyltransferase
MKKIITYGTFDLLHHGHINLLRRARELGDHLTVALSTDEFNLGKGKVCFHPYEQRVALLEAIRYVDCVIPETHWEQKVQDVQNLGIHTFTIGDDWAGHFDFLMPHCQVVYLGRTPDISTTQIKQKLASFQTPKPTLPVGS